MKAVVDLPYYVHQCLLTLWYRWCPSISWRKKNSTLISESAMTSKSIVRIQCMLYNIMYCLYMYKLWNSVTTCIYTHVHVHVRIINCLCCKQDPEKWSIICAISDHSYVRTRNIFSWNPYDRPNFSGHIKRSQSSTYCNVAFWCPLE